MKKIFATICILTLLAAPAFAQWNRVNRPFTEDQVLAQSVWKDSTGKRGIAMVALDEATISYEKIPPSAATSDQVFSTILLHNSQGQGALGVYLIGAGGGGATLPDSTEQYSMFRAAAPPDWEEFTDLKLLDGVVLYSEVAAPGPAFEMRAQDDYDNTETVFTMTENDGGDTIITLSGVSTAAWMNLNGNIELGSHSPGAVLDDVPTLKFADMSAAPFPFGGIIMAQAPASAPGFLEPEAFYLVQTVDLTEGKLLNVTDGGDAELTVNHEGNTNVSGHFQAADYVWSRSGELVMGGSPATRNIVVGQLAGSTCLNCAIPVDRGLIVGAGANMDSNDVPFIFTKNGMGTPADLGVFITGAGHVGAVTLGGAMPESDVAPLTTVIKGADAYSGATVNMTANPLYLRGGIGSKYVTVVDYSQGAGDTLTVTIDGTPTVLTEGVEFDCSVSNLLCGNSIRLAIDTLSGTRALVDTSLFRTHVFPNDGSRRVALATGDPTAWTVQNGTDGGLVEVSDNFGVDGDVDIVNSNFHFMDADEGEFYVNLENPASISGSDPSIPGYATDSATATNWIMGNVVRIPSRLYIAGTVEVDVTVVSSTPYTPGTVTHMLVDDTTVGAVVNINLTAAANVPGRIYSIKKIGNSYNVNINANGIETIDGVTTKTLTTQYAALTIVCDGSNWFII